MPAPGIEPEASVFRAGLLTACDNVTDCRRGE